MPFRDMAALAAVILIWAANFSAAKLALEEFHPFLMLTLRFGFLALILSPFLMRPVPQGHLRLIPVALCLGGAHFGLLFLGLSGTDAGAAAIVIQLGIPFSVLLAWWLQGDGLSRLQWLGLGVAFTGVYVLSGSPRLDGQWGALVMIAGAAFAWAAANILIKRLGPINGFVLNAWVVLFALPVHGAASLILETNHLDRIAAAGWQGWGGIAFQALASTIVAYGLWYWLLGRHPVSRLVPPGLLIPGLAVAIAVPVLGEPVTWAVVVGGGLTVLGVGMVELARGRRKPAPA